MKRFLRRRVSWAGFSLVELLVVMAIIAILAAALTVAAGSAIRAAKRAQAQNMASQIQTAAQNYYTEYSVYPIPTGTVDLLLDDADSAGYWSGMVYGLCGNINPYNGSTSYSPTGTVSNTRSIPFMTLKPTDVESAAFPRPLNALTAGNKYFNMAMDGDYSNIVGDSGSIITKIPNFAASGSTISYLSTGGVTGGVIVWANCNTNTLTQKAAYFVHAGF